MTKIKPLFVHFHTYISSHEGCGGISPMRIRNTSGFSEISDSFTGSSLHQDGTKSKVGDVIYHVALGRVGY